MTPHRRARRWGRLRRATQGAAALLYLALPLVNAQGRRGVLGSLASTRAGPIELLEPSAAVTALAAAAFDGPVGTILLAAAPPALLAFALGPVFCAWLCPFGLVSEGLDRLRRRRAWRRDEHVRARAPRAIFLAAVVAVSAAVALPLGALLQGPRALSVAALEGLYLGAVSPFAAAVLGALLLAELLLPRRLFCRALCPAGATANLLRTPVTLRIAHEAGGCAGCGAEPRCQRACPWGVDPRSAGRFDGCTHCMACVEACPPGTLEATFRPPGASRPPA